jgi:hypothetical protein
MALVPQRQQIEQGRRQREAYKADEHNRDHGVPNEGHVAPQRRHHVLAFHHGLTALKELRRPKTQYSCLESDGP